MEADTSLFSSLFSAILIGGLAGWLAGKIVRGGGFGLVGNVILGIGGAILANFALPLLGLGFGSGFFGSVLSAMIGAAVVLVIIRMIKQV
ncbi:GlsB/YeaQ/YmgE family stress response membrane protein [Shimia haliotis]|uniref:Uncharacterized membrane protein YeaQ/YmgE, transglycosylase-associated protein family n=1 Tax=Shimia haliotis TaxID=1280847 RepID=A0A1I4AGP2_9RHOB|nr:GlsB/YeaQ/YmgE family stress response membrane protein [Shimia haliotis]SFK55091.1 Uncharacterized membrane protein YeaQ/YmgE, transglycosylase-associated protein family [Shimia haliotis]